MQYMCLYATYYVENTKKKQSTYYFASFSKNIFALSSSNRFIFTIEYKICWIYRLLSGTIAFGKRNKQKNVHALYRY